MARYRQADHRAVRAIGWDPALPAKWANEHILYSPGTSNSHLVETAGGDVIINTGVSYEGDRHKERFEELLGRPLNVAKIILTQYHSDHVGGWQTFTGPAVETLAQQEQPRLRQEWMDLIGFYQPRGTRFLKLMMPKAENREKFFQPALEPEGVTYFGDCHRFELGGVTFELISASSGETLDTCWVWLPGEKTVFSGNFLGALYGALPNFYTIRGDRQRSVPGFIKDIQRLIELEPELLITGHEHPICGRDQIAGDLVKIRDAVRYLHDETVKGMNAQRSLFQLMRDIQLPAELTPRPGRTPTQWIVRAVWEEYAGWFRQESTTELYGVPPSSVWPRLLALAGGPAAVVAQARECIEEGKPLEALHLTDIVVDSYPCDRAAREAEIRALEMLIDMSGGTAFDEMGWLENAIAEARAAMEHAGQSRQESQPIE